MKNTVITVVLMALIGMSACKSHDVDLTEEPLIRFENTSGSDLIEVIYQDSLYIGDLPDGAVTDWYPVRNVWCYAHHQLSAKQSVESKPLTSRQAYCGNDECLYIWYYDGRYEVQINSLDDRMLYTTLELIE